MDCRLLLLPLPALIAAPVVHATTYLTLDQVQSQLFPGETLTASFVTLSADQSSAVARDSGASAGAPTVRAWHASGGGWLLLDQVYGRHQLITYAVALDAQGAVRQVEVMEYLEAYGGEIRNTGWCGQFRGKRHGDPVAIGSDIQNISGATLSSHHVTDGIRRLLSTYALVLAPAEAAAHAAH